ncbi:MAG: uroporphyrinogen decarboxylase/cobalamine-independent methonine synthase family protein [Armatimonadota bacterium]
MCNASCISPWRGHCVELRGKYRMNNRQRLQAILHYQDYDRLPLAHFGFWKDTLEKWVSEGHLTQDELQGVGDGTDGESSIATKLGFDFNYYTVIYSDTGLFPGFEEHVIEELPDGTRKVVNVYGVVVLEKDDAGSIPAEIDHLLKGRKEWEEHFLPRLQFDPARVIVSEENIARVGDGSRAEPIGLHCGSLFGVIRNWLGVEGSAYLFADDEVLFREIIDHVGDLSYRCAEAVLESVSGFDFAHFWEDICFKNGPLIIPSVFDEFVGPHYKRITELVNRHGMDIVSLDCDGLIDSLIPTWLNNGVNTMFPIEVGTWNGSVGPWREEYGRQIRGVGGMNKTVFTFDYSAIDAEIERLKPLVELGGYLPCPDHRIAPDAKWENVQYYCDKMKNVFG